MSKHEVSTQNADEYWKANVRIILVCLVIWAVCSLGFAILLRPALMGITFMGTDFGVVVWSARGYFDLCGSDFFLHLAYEQAR